MTRRWDRAAGFLLLFGATSLAAVAVGAFVSASSGVPAAIWARNLAAWAIGGVAGTAIAATFRPAFLPVALWAAPVGLAASLLSRGLQGVHRWIDIGPVHCNTAMLLLPGAVVALGMLAGERAWAWAAAVASLGLLAAQPDASQATTLALVAVLIVVATVRRPILRGALIAAAAFAAAFAWLRPDPLQPVPEVEGIIGLAWRLSPAVAGLACLLLGALAAVASVGLRSSPPALRLSGLALSLYFLLWAMAPALGAFPVPFVGMGLGPILGAWLGVGLLAGLLKMPEPAQGRRLDPALRPRQSPRP